MLQPIYLTAFQSQNVDFNPIPQISRWRPFFEHSLKHKPAHSLSPQVFRLFIFPLVSEIKGPETFDSPCSQTKSWSFKFCVSVLGESEVLTCVDSVTEASCRYSEFPQPNTCPSLETARLQSPYELICCTSTPVRSPSTSTGRELTSWCPKPETSHNTTIKLTLRSTEWL